MESWATWLSVIWPVSHACQLLGALYSRVTFLSQLYQMQKMVASNTQALKALGGGDPPSRVTVPESRDIGCSVLASNLQKPRPLASTAGRPGAAGQRLLLNAIALSLTHWGSFIHSQLHLLRTTKDIYRGNTTNTGEYAPASQ